MTAAQLVVDADRPVGTIHRRLFGSFVEHLGRAVYDGTYEPGHPERVRARTNDTAHLTDGRLRLELPPVSWTALSLA